MNPRTTALLAVVAATFAAWLWFYEIEGEADRAATQAESLRLFPELASDGRSIAWIELTASDGTPVRAERSEGRWSLVAPIAFPADAVSFDAMASALAQAAGGGPIDSPQAAKVYGLAEAATRIEFGEAGGAAFVLLTGRAAPLGSEVYVARGDSAEVHLVPSWRVNAFDKPLETLRDARVQPFDRSTIASIAASWPGGAVRLRRELAPAQTSDDSKWRLVEPLEALADDDRVDSLLTDLMHLRADGFVDSAMTDAEAGLEPPDFEVELHPAGAGAAALRVAIGQERDGLRRVRGRDGVLYELASERLADFPRSVVEFRDRTLSRFVGADATGFEIAFVDPAQSGPSAAPSYRVSAVRDGLDWNVEPPLREGVATDIVATLANLSAREIQADWLGDAERAALGLAPPRVVLRVTGEAVGDGEGDPNLIGEVWLGRFDPGRGIAAMAAGRDEIFLLEARLAENLPTSKVAFEAQFAARPAAAAPAPSALDAAVAPDKAVVPGAPAQPGR